MTRRNLATLAVLAAALVAVAIYVSRTRHTEQAAGVGELLYPGLEASLDQVKTVRILGPGGKAAVTLTRTDGGWRVAERSGYPADATHVRTLVLGLAQARMLEEKTSLPASYPSLGVEDLAAPGASGAGVELEGPPQPVSLIVGKSSGARSTFVRRKGETASWQIGTSIAVERDPAKWLATDVLDIGADRIQSVEFTAPGKRPWTAAKASRAAMSFTVTGKPPGGKSKPSGGAPAPDSGTDRVATALANLRLTDVRRAQDQAASKPAATSTFRTFDGLVLAIDGFAEGDKRYVSVHPSLDESAARRFFVAPAAPVDGDSAAEPKPATTRAAPATDSKPAVPAAKAEPSTGPTDKPAASTPETVFAQTSAESSKLEAKLAGWMFEIPTWSYDTIFVQP